MNGSEGGIPFRTPSRPRIYHAPTQSAAPRPLCDIRAFTVFITPEPDLVTCPDCLRIRSAS